MTIFKDTVVWVLFIIGAIITLATWVFFDPSSYIDGFLREAAVKDKYDDLLNIVSWFIKIPVTFLIIAACYLTAKWRALPKSLTYEKLADEILKLRKKPTSIEIIGYSLGFANPIKFRLDDQPWKNLDVTIYNMKEKTILDNFRELKSLDHRVDVISERLEEWKTLEREGKIGSLCKREIGELIPFAAVVVDGTRLFVSNYNWKVQGSRLSLQKIPAPERLFFEISRVEGAYETMMAVIKTFRRHG